MAAPLLMLLLPLHLAAPAEAQAVKPPSRQVPPTVLAEVQALESRFELALAADCDDDRCFPKGCTYVDHAVADRARSRSLPGLTAEGSGPGSVEAQEFLTRATCAFAYEEAVERGDVQALVRRLQGKLTGGWLSVTVTAQELQPLPPYFRDAPEVEEAEETEVEEPEPLAEEPEPWSWARAGQELWAALLPHFYWMVGLGLATLAGILLIWGWRRVGQASFEEQALLAQLQGGQAGPGAAGEAAEEAVAAEVVEVPETDAEYVARQEAAWRLKLQAMDPDAPSAELQALVKELLRTGEVALLAKAVLRFPEHFPAAFPEGAELAAPKLALAQTLKTVSPEELPKDRAFFEALERHAISARLSSQGDAEVVRSLREDFGSAGLARMIGRVPPRLGALVFALAPPSSQQELVRLLDPHQVARLAEQLLRSDRMDPAEARALVGLLQAARQGTAPPEGLDELDVTDRGTPFDAVGALSVLLPRLHPARQGELFAGALERFGGTLPGWTRSLVLPSMISRLSPEAQADLFLEVDVDPLAAWLSVQDAEDRSALLAAMPRSLQASIGGASAFPDRERQLALAARGRAELARALQGQLARAGLSFEEAVRAGLGSGGGVA